MKKSRKAYTLVELLVAIAIATIVIAATAATLAFVIQSTAKAEESASMNFKARTIRDSILSDGVIDSINTSEEFVYDEEKNEVFDTRRDKTVVREALYTEVIFAEEDDFIVCTIKYKPYKKSTEMETISFVVKQIE